MTAPSPRIMDASVRIDHIPATGRDVKVVPSPEEREELAKLLEISKIDRLEISLSALPFRGGVRVVGRLVASVTQPCVVTFVPVHQDIDEPIDRVFLPGVDKTYAGPAGAEVFVDLEGEEIPDYFDGSEADLSDLLIETLALAIDPYPRAEGASVEALGISDTDNEESPFAALKSLKGADEK
jgi:uncharacterized metal-binding protein YceD (DUF177 family)